VDIVSFVYNCQMVLAALRTVCSGLSRNDCAWSDDVCVGHELQALQKINTYTCSVYLHTHGIPRHSYLQNIFLSHGVGKFYMRNYA
jgi:hypothetical protein